MAADDFAIIGVGASAGGIKAMRGFFGGLPQDLDAAVVVVTHLHPEGTSQLPEVLAQFSPLPVEVADDGAEVLPGHVYVMPPGVLLGIRDGRLTATPLEPGAREPKPIDIFLTALAINQGERAVGVILSGADGDGAIGVKAIKEHGGLTLAQAPNGGGPDTPDMPLSALRTGHVDFAVPAHEMGFRIAAYRAPPDDRAAPEALSADSANDLAADALAEIYAILRQQVGHDFSGYKLSTFRRRLQRRITINCADGPGVYLDLLRSDSAEAAALFRDLLVNVTKFFRDPEAFAALAAQVVPKLFEGRGPDDAVRVWVPACATGEEVYTIAILLREHAETLSAPPQVQIFATDIDEHSLTVARLGRYPASYLDAVSPERLARQFTVREGSVVVQKALRDMCTFAPHSVLRDPPFSRIDLVSCRNLLIYLNAEAQARVVPTLHYALRPSGHLFIGMAENVTRFDDLFTPIEKAHRIFKARDIVPPVQMPSMAGFEGLRFEGGEPGKRGNGIRHAGLRQRVEAEMLASFTPPHAVVTRSGEAMHYSARIGDYLEVAPGQPTRELAALARKGLRLDLRAVLREAIERNAAAVRDGLEVELADGRMQALSLVVKPLPASQDEEPLFLVIFDEAAVPVDPTRRKAEARAGQTEEIQRLERELSSTRERLQATVEEYETSLEESKSTNEELHSINEEMQAANEELSASKEEIQSVNEELQTVNIQLNAKIEALDRLSEDQAILFKTTEIASVFLTPDLRIRVFTQAAAEIFGIRAGDEDRLLSNFAAPFSLAWLPEDARAAMTTGQAVDRALEGSDGLGYRARTTAVTRKMFEAHGFIVNFVQVTDPEG